ncbi:hypothetical protein GCM10011346_52860 [Oceanobacillus neutriphilus]|uniref:Uncharacterized protein n=1 Tax=Oceanobacillus neutriphilus TaxID=531815 RepID=A0ABQ2P3H4_9BACI|nr:hypothetical protein GCM10011346_52860 [Oceanobacillus neutriphilus]
MENNRINSIANSLAGQVADKALRIAELETVAAEQQAKIEELEKTLKEKEIEEMDKEAELSKQKKNNKEG